MSGVYGGGEVCGGGGGGGGNDHTSAAIRVVDVQIPVARLTAVTVVTTDPFFAVTQLTRLDIAGATASKRVARHLLRSRRVAVAFWVENACHVFNLALSSWINKNFMFL